MVEPLPLEVLGASRACTFVILMGDDISIGLLAAGVSLCDLNDSLLSSAVGGCSVLLPSLLKGILVGFSVTGLLLSALELST